MESTQSVVNDRYVWPKELRPLFPGKTDRTLVNIFNRARQVLGKKPKAYLLLSEVADYLDLDPVYLDGRISVKKK